MKEPLAYKTMLQFLDDRYRRLPSEELGSLLGDLQLLEDAQPADPAVAEEWNSAISEAQRKGLAHSVGGLRRAG